MCEIVVKMLIKILPDVEERFSIIHACFFIVSLIVSTSYPTHSQKLLDLQNITRVCLRLAENKVNEPAFVPEPGYCDGWSCWESQLTLTNKMRISRIINSIRNTLATNITNMHKLSWHWTLEQEAIRASKKCDRRSLEIYDERRNIEGLGSSLYCENGCLYKVMTLNPSQNLLLQVLHDLVMNNSLQDFDSNGNYRRANAMFYGCAIVVRSALLLRTIYEDVYHMVCVFCTSEREMKSVYGNSATESQCPPMTMRGKDPRYPLLCAVNGRQSIYICPAYKRCPPEAQPRQLNWQTREPGRVLEVIVVQTKDGPRLLVKKEILGKYDEAGNPKDRSVNYILDNTGEYLKILSYYPQIPKTVYAYDDYYETIRQRLYEATNGTQILQHPELTEYPVIYEPGKAIEGSEDAWCCIYLLVLSSILTCILMALICCTVFTR